ncbi:MAG: hypothetical protein R3E02_10200 [Blastomonas sp.]
MSDEVLQDDFQDDSEDFPVFLFPLIRTNEMQHRLFLERKRVCALYEDRLISAVVSRKVRIPVEAFEPDGAETFKKAVASGAEFFDIALHRMASVFADLDTDATRDTVIPTVRFDIAVTESDRVLKFQVLLGESPNIVRAFRHLLGDRFTLSEELAARFETRQLKRLVRDEANRTHARSHAGTAPRRSKPLGIAVFLAGVAAFAAAGWMVWQIIDGGNDFWMNVGGTLVALFLGFTLVRHGQGLAAPDFDNVMSRSEVSPILYLRSFKSEDSDIPPRIRTFWDDAISRLLWRAWPIAIMLEIILGIVRFVRFLTGTGSGRVEERIAPVLRRFGPMVAIGRPGDVVASLGAARAYVSDDDWQDFILDMLERSQLVVIQVESTDGTWWEFSQAIAKVPPERLLMMFTARFGSFQHYEEVREKAALLLPKPLPRVIGNNAFLYFDSEWNAYPLDLKYFNRLIAPLAATPVNWRRSLAEFCQRFEPVGRIR